MRLTFEERVFQHKSVFRNIDVFRLLWRVILDVSCEISLDLQSFWLGAETNNVVRVLIKLSVQLD